MIVEIYDIVRQWVTKPTSTTGSLTPVNFALKSVDPKLMAFGLEYLEDLSKFVGLSYIVKLMETDDNNRI